MHELFKAVLAKRDLSRAGDLFSLEDAKIVDDLSAVVSSVIQSFLLNKLLTATCLLLMHYSSRKYRQS